MRSTAPAMHDGAAPSKSMENRRCKCTCILRRSMIFAPHSKLVLTRNLKTILVDLLADPGPGSDARDSRTPPVARNGRRVARRSPPLEKLGELFVWSGASGASQRAREQRASVASRARASSTAGAAVSRCVAPLQPRRAASVPGAAQKHIHCTPSTRRNAVAQQYSARGKWLPKPTPPT